MTKWRFRSGIDAARSQDAVWQCVKIPKLEANKVASRKQASSGTELTQQPTLANWPCWEQVCSLIWVQHHPHTDFPTGATIFAREVSVICRHSNLCRGSWRGMAWLEGMAAQLPVGFGWDGGSSVPTWPQTANAHLGGKVRWSRRKPRPIAGRSWADKPHQGHLVWLQPWVQEIQAGAGETWGKVVVSGGERLRVRRQQEGAGDGVKTERW